MPIQRSITTSNPRSGSGVGKATSLPRDVGTVPASPVTGQLDVGTAPSADLATRRATTANGRPHHAECRCHPDHGVVLGDIILLDARRQPTTSTEPHDEDRGAVHHTRGGVRTVRIDGLCAGPPLPRGLRDHEVRSPCRRWCRGPTGLYRTQHVCIVVGYTAMVLALDPLRSCSTGLQAARSRASGSCAALSVANCPIQGADSKSGL